MSSIPFFRGRNDGDDDKLRYFQTLASMSVTGSVDVHMTDIPTAACKFDEDRGTHDILMREGTVPVASDIKGKTNLNESEISLMAKEGMLYHELGHVLYTDHDAWESQLRNVSKPPVRERVANLLNIMEDAVIESYLIENFNIARLLSLKNENKHKTLGVFAGGDPNDPAQLNPYFEDPLAPLDVAMITFEEMGRFSLGIIETHLDSDDFRELTVKGDKFTADDVIQYTVECLNDCVVEPEAAARYHRTYDLFDRLWTDQNMESEIDADDLSPDIGNSPPGSDQEQNSFLIETPDIDGEGGQDDEDEEEESDGSGGDGDDDEQADDEDAEAGAQPVDGEDDGDEEDGTGASQSGDEEPEGSGDDGDGASGSELPGDVDDPGIAGDDLDGDDFDDAQDESGVVDDDGDDGDDGMQADPSAEIPDDLKQAFKRAGAGAGNIQVREEPRSGDGTDPSRKAEAIRMSRSIQRIVEDFLHQREKSRTDRNRFDGKFDDRSLISAERGSPRVFKKDDKPDELDYHCVICMDESGSMRGSDMAAASMATAALTRGLEEAGVDVDVYRFGRNVNLVKTAAERWDDVSDLLIERATSGATCLLPALQQVGKRADLHDKQTFVVTITDGKPSGIESCKDEIRDMPFPTMSMQIRQSTDEFDDVYDALENVSDSSGITTGLRTLIRRTVFK